MPMLTPCHPGEILREEVLKPLDLTVTAAARALGVSRMALSNIVNEHAGVSAEMAVRIAKAFGGAPEIWVRMQGSHDLARAKRRAATLKVRRIFHAAQPPSA